MKKGLCSSAEARVRAVWVPAFAGTTCWKIPYAIALPLWGRVREGVSRKHRVRDTPLSTSPPQGGREQSALGAPLRFPRAASQHLMHGDDDAVGMPRADPDEQVFHQPAILF